MCINTVRIELTILLISVSIHVWFSLEQLNAVTEPFSGRFPI
jgi:hypothetical protein